MSLQKNPNHHQRFGFFWSGLLDSNQRPRAPQTCALPTALNPDPLRFAVAKLRSFIDMCKFLIHFFFKIRYITELEGL